MLFHRNNEAYIKEIAADKERIREVLKVLFSWFRDVMLLKAAENERLIHLDRLRDLKRTETQYSSAQIEEILGAIVNTAKLVEDNLNVKIPLAILREKIWVK